ncbi:MAG: hypothetical protein OXF45_01935 [Candidatus Dadabacteria bacterium]|nr:hypothetical protein [Candidatus Dadabacteria bacterium]
MNSDLVEVIRTYATKSHSDLNDLLLGKSKHNIISILVDLLTTYYNDKNSSTLREFVVVSLSGFESNPDKIGYNGYKHDGIGKRTKFCEAKPKNVNTNDTKPKRLNGGGNFTDYTWARLRKDKRSNPTMLIGGFVDGRLIYIFKFPFNSKGFISRLEYQLNSKFPDGDISGIFLRSASFGFNHYRDARGLEVEIFVSRQELPQYENSITKGLYSFIEQHARSDET